MDHYRASADSGGRPSGVMVHPDDEDDEVLNNTLYELAHLHEYTARKVEADDIRSIRNLLKDDDYCNFHFEDPLFLFETCCFSIVVSDVVETDRLVAVAFLDDTSASPDLMKSSKRWKSSHDLRSMSPINTYYMRCFVCSPEVAEDVCLTEIISHTFASSIHIDYIVVEMPELNYSGSYLFSPLVKEAEITVGKQKRRIFIYQKDLLMPHLIVREGREHDLDDLLPLLPMDTQMMEQHFGKSSLSDIIAMAEKGNQSMIAEWKMEAVGIISVSADIDYELLNSFYHLEPFHGLRKPHRNDEIYIDDRPPKIRTEIDFEKLMKQAQHTFKDKNLKIDRQNEGKAPYKIEVIKDFSMSSVGGASDGSSQAIDKQFNEKAQGPHQFTVRVSQDIIMYGLRPRGPLDADDFGCGGDKTSALSDLPTDGEGLGLSGEDADEERTSFGRMSASSSARQRLAKSVDAGDTEKRGTSSSVRMDVIVEEMTDEEGISTAPEDGGGGVEVVEILDGDDIQLSSLGEDGEMEVSAGIVEEEDDEEGMEKTITQQTDVSVEFVEEKEVTEENTVDEGYGEEDEEPTISGREHTTEPGDTSEPPSLHQAQPKEAAAGSGEVAAAEEGAATTVASTAPAKEDEGPPPHPIESKTEAPTRKASVAASILSVDDSQTGLHGAGEDAGQTTTDQQQSQIEEDTLKELEEQEDPTKLTIKNKELLEQLPPEIRQRLSEDTLLPGRHHPSRTINDKVEIFKRIWDIYTLIQDNGITLDQVKTILTPMDLLILEDADLLSNESLIEYIVALLPSDSPYLESNKKEEEEVKKSVFRGIANGLAVKLFNMGKKHMPRNMDLFRDIFKAFPNREYLIVTVPVGGNVKEPSWLENFVRIIPRPETSYPRDLFVLHKVVITSKIRVRRAKERDIGHVKNFLASLIEKERIFQDFLRALDKHTSSSQNQSIRVPKMNCYLAEVKNYEDTPIIGLIIVSNELEAKKYLVNYDLEKHTYFGAHDENTAHGYVHHLLINPIFQRHAKLFLKEVMRLDEKESMFHRVYPRQTANGAVVAHQSILNNMEDWIPIMPRKRIHYGDLNLLNNYDDERQPPSYAQTMEDPYAVIHTAKRFIMEPKITLTKRLVFVGASTTTLSCLEKLISSTYRNFKYLTVIDPFGLPGQLPDDPVRDEFFGVRNGGTKMSYASDAEWVQRTGIHLWVQVVVGKVTKIVRDSKYVVVNGDCSVPYDKLVLASGVQFQRLDSPTAEINDPNFMAFKMNTITHELQEHNRPDFNRDQPKPKNIFMINHELEAHTALEYLRKFRSLMGSKKVLIFGGGLQTFACIKAVLAAGIPATSIALIGTPEKETEWEQKSGYTLSSKVKGPMEKELAKLGVTVISNYEFDRWETCPISGLVKRTFFKSLTERHAQISFQTFALFCYRYRRVDDGIVSALSESYLLYQNGIVIDADFKTDDPHIYAAGPATTYQKILLADHQNHAYYQSEEIGYKLAEFLIDSSGTEGGGQGKLEDLNVIKFKKPLTRAIKLLGGWHYLYLRSPGSHSRCSDLPGSTCEETCECLTEVVTGSVHAEEDPQQKFFKIRLDDKSRIVSLECMAKMPFSFSNISALYGKHETLLNKMMERLEIGETTCLYDHFRQPWFSVFCIDEWDNFASELKDLYSEHKIGDGANLMQFIRDFISSLDNPEALRMDPNIIRSVWRTSNLKDIVEDKLLNFLKFHRNSLPMYAQNNYVDDLLEERSSSALYYPNTKAHMIQ